MTNVYYLVQKSFWIVKYTVLLYCPTIIYDKKFYEGPNAVNEEGV